MSSLPPHGRVPVRRGSAHFSSGVITPGLGSDRNSRRWGSTAPRLPRCSWKTAALCDAGQPFTKEASMAKLFATDAAMDITLDALQVFGGYGYLEEYPMARRVRDAKACQIYEGTNQVQRMVIARELVRV